MTPQKIPTKKEDIVVENIFWSFWHSKYAYNINNEYICFIKTRRELIDEKGYSIQGLSCRHNKRVSFGTFTLYKVFCMSEGQFGINITKPVCSIDIKTEIYDIDTFKQQGIYECYRLYISESLI